MKIRNATIHDLPAIEQVHLDAFGPGEGPVVAKLAIKLLTAAAVESTSVFAAEEDEMNEERRIVGSVIFSAVRISGHDGLLAAILAPLAVITVRQRNGIGRALVRHGLDAMKNQGVNLVLVYGDPRY